MQQIVLDRIDSRQEKDKHEWQQSLDEARYMIENLTAPGDLVVDPMAGSGTTLLAAKELDRRYCGIEVKPATYALAAQRLAAIATSAGRDGQQAYRQRVSAGVTAP